MEYVLVNNRSAIECWERGYSASAVPVSNCQDIALAGGVIQFRQAMKSLPGIGAPVETLVHRKEQRNHAEGCHPRVWCSPLPRDAICVLPGTNVAVSAPWFCFLQLAARMPFPQAVLLGMELCGRYSTLPFSRAATSSYKPTPRERENGFVKRPPLLTPRELSSALGAALPPESEAKALAAAKLVGANAYSPAEARHYIQLFTPTRRGGYGLPRPLLNVSVPLPRELSMLARRADYICDFFYPEARLAIEYDGGYHWNGEQRLDDNLRELILDALEIEVVRVDRHQLESSEAADISAQAIAKRLGVKLRKPSAASLATRRELQRQLRDYSFDLFA